MGIVSLYPESGNSSLTDIPPNLTNPVCIGTAALLAEAGSTADANLGTNSSFPIPLEQSLSNSDVQGWCPWDLQLNIPIGPADGVYAYPDLTVERPHFDPCYSACAKNNKPSDCCTGLYDSPSVCKPSQYSQDAKKVCPDAYSFGIVGNFRFSKKMRNTNFFVAFDDQTSTFIIPSGGGFQVVFCPPGRSTTILSTMASQLQQLSQTGHVTARLLQESANVTLIRSQSEGAECASFTIGSVILSLVATTFIIWG